MKGNEKMKAVKILTIILIVILLALVGFLGIYSQELNFMENKVTGYEYTRNLEGKRVVKLSVSETTTTLIKDQDGNEVEGADTLTDEEIIANGYVKEEIKYNGDDKRIYENYLKSKEIIEKRLSELSVNDYTIKLDDQNGDLILELTENTDTDFVVANIHAVGNFEIIDVKTEEVLMDNNDIEDVKIQYAQSQSLDTPGTEVYLTVEFKKESEQKLEDITNKYVPLPDVIVTQPVEGGAEGETEEVAEPVDNSVTMQIDETAIMTTEFEEPIETGEISLVVGSASIDEETLNSNIQQAVSMSTIMKYGEMPLTYEITQNQFIASDITENDLVYFVYGLIGLVILATIILTIKFGISGLLTGISTIGFIGIYSLIIRYTNVELSIESLVAVIAILVLQIALLKKVLLKVKGEETVKNAIRESYKEFFSYLIPIIIMSITFVFVDLIPMASFGMVMFWGFVVIAVYNITITNILLRIRTEK